MDVHPTLYQALESTALHATAPIPFHSPLREQAVVLCIVAALHVAVFTAWMKQPTRAVRIQHEMEVSVAISSNPVKAQVETLPPPRVPEKIAVQPDPAEQQEVLEEPIMENAASAIIESTPSASQEVPVLSDIEPDYKATYLNNRLIYPLAARRAGLQGRVVLNVEVLADGVSGQVQIHQSSGHAILDRAALVSVKTWRFVPARRGGRNVTEWFKIPILFSLKDNET